VTRLDGVIYTHEHADHMHGIDDLREINRAMKAPLPIWASPRVLDSIAQRFPYVLEPLSDGPVIYKPVLVTHPAEDHFTIGTIPVTSFAQDHGFGPSLGLRFGPIAYSTDVVEIPEDSFAALAGVRVWIVGCLTENPHPTHAHVDKVLAWVARVRPERTILTHLGHRMDYRRLLARLPAGIEPAYDGMIVEA
jgi:phosphoribosyl 1,2-cyclic phosphate phosphodiesterase